MPARQNHELTVREFAPASDYEGCVAVQNAAKPYWPTSVEEVRHRDSVRVGPFARFVAEVAGRVVGVAVYDVDPTVVAPGRFDIGVAVHPDWQRQGIGSALYSHVLAASTELGATSWVTGYREDVESARHFLEHRGFAEMDRSWDSHLDLTTLDLSRWAEVAQRACNEARVEIRSLAELMPEVRDWRERCHDLDQTTSLDMPHPDPIGRMEFEAFCKYYLDGPKFLPEGYFIARSLENGEWLGLSTLTTLPAEPDCMCVGMTGVRRTWRRRGIATALKVTALQFACKRPGIVRIWTGNAQSNRGMLAINEALGFVKEPAVVWMKKRVGSG